MVLSASSQKRRNVDNLPTFDVQKIIYVFYLVINQNDFKVNYRRRNFPITIGKIKPP